MADENPVWGAPKIHGELLKLGFSVSERTVASLPQPTNDAAWWEARTKGFDFSREDRIDSDKFNRILLEGLMGDTPYPTTRSGADLRHSGTPQPETKQLRSNDK